MLFKVQMTVLFRIAFLVSGILRDVSSLAIRQLVYYGQQSLTRDNAVQFCRNYNSNLVKVDSEEVLQALHMFYLSEKNERWNTSWIGMFYDTNHGMFLWDECSPVQFSMMESIDTSPKLPCVELDPRHIDSNKDWNLVDCLDPHPFMCELSHGVCNTFVEYDIWKSDIFVCKPRPLTCTLDGGSGIPRETCESRCIQESTAAQCYGYSYGGPDNKCRLHFADSATSLWFSQDLDRTLPLYILFCFEFVIQPSPLYHHRDDRSEEVSLPACPNITSVSTIHSTCPDDTYRPTLWETMTAITYEMTNMISLVGSSTSLSDKTTSPSDDRASPFDSTTSIPENTTSLLDNRTYLLGNTTMLLASTMSWPDNRSSHFDNTTSFPDVTTSISNDRKTRTENSTLEMDSVTTVILNKTVARHCNCPRQHCGENFTAEERKRNMIDILDSLTPNVRNLSATIRKFSCASDDRLSSQGIGVLGTILMVTVFGGLAIPDIFSFLQWLKQTAKKKGCW